VKYVSRGEERALARAEWRLDNQRRTDESPAIQAAPEIDELQAATAYPLTESVSTPRASAQRRPRNRPQIPLAAATETETEDDLYERYRAVLQQTVAAHRVIGRLNFERDALARQVKLLQASAAESAPPAILTATPRAVPVPAPHPAPLPGHQDPTLLRALDQFFNGGTLWDVRKRRMGFVFGLLAVFVLAWAISQTGVVVLPARLSRDSLGDLPFVGTTLRFVMGVWSMFRVVRISARGVRWAFPEEGGRRRRR
jgi:hypothetical protein